MLVSKICWSVKILVGNKKSRQKILVGNNFSHLPKIWSLFTDLFFTAKVYYNRNPVWESKSLIVKSLCYHIHDSIESSLYLAFL